MSTIQSNGTAFARRAHVQHTGPDPHAIEEPTHSWVGETVLLLAGVLSAAAIFLIVLVALARPAGAQGPIAGGLADPLPDAVPSTSTAITNLAEASPLQVTTSNQTTTVVVHLPAGPSASITVGVLPLTQVVVTTGVLPAITPPSVSVTGSASKPPTAQGVQPQASVANGTRPAPSVRSPQERDASVPVRAWSASSNPHSLHTSSTRNPARGSPGEPFSGESPPLLGGSGSPMSALPPAALLLPALLAGGVMVRRFGFPRLLLDMRNAPPG